MKNSVNLDIDDETASVIADLKPKKRVQFGSKKGKLTNHRVYLAGPIDNASDDGVGWRQLATPYLKERGIQILDPTDKPTSQCRFNEIGDEKEMISKMVEVADFLIAYIDPDMHICGTYDEIFEALRHRKPTLVVHKGGKARMSMWLRGKLNHNFVFETFAELFNYIDALHDGTIEPDYTRWVFFDKV
jgi:hypothetical protein